MLKLKVNSGKHLVLKAAANRGQKHQANSVSVSVTLPKMRCQQAEWKSQHKLVVCITGTVPGRRFCAYMHLNKFYLNALPCCLWNFFQNYLHTGFRVDYLEYSNKHKPSQLLSSSNQHILRMAVFKMYSEYGDCGGGNNEMTMTITWWSNYSKQINNERYINFCFGPDLL